MPGLPYCILMTKTGRMTSRLTGYCAKWNTPGTMYIPGVHDADFHLGGPGTGACQPQGAAGGLDFARVGQLFLHAYHAHPQVQTATVLFITAPDFPYELLAQKAAKMETVTNSLDQIFSNLVMDCRSCSLKPVCDEVEGLRELHFHTFLDMHNASQACDTTQIDI